MLYFLIVVIRFDLHLALTTIIVLIGPVEPIPFAIIVNLEFDQSVHLLGIIITRHLVMEGTAIILEVGIVIALDVVAETTLVMVGIDHVLMVDIAVIHHFKVEDIDS